MKLAEALSIRADNNKRLNSLASRAQSNCQVQEGEDPAENPDALIDEWEGLIGDQENLIQLIHTTNNQPIPSGSGYTLSELIVKRDFLLKKAEFFNQLTKSAKTITERYGLSEIKKVRIVNVSELQKQADEYSKLAREMDVVIQQINWSVDLIQQNALDR